MMLIILLGDVNFGSITLCIDENTYHVTAKDQ